MQRTIAGFHQDEAGGWVAELSCLHGQHIRHNPPFRLAPWVLDDAERATRIGAPIDCPLCDRAELPSGLEVVQRTETWDERSMPTALRGAHRVGAGRWGLLQVEEGRLRFRASTEPPIDVLVTPEAPQPIPPEVEHEVEPLGCVRFFVEFLGRGPGGT